MILRNWTRPSEWPDMVFFDEAYRLRRKFPRIGGVDPSPPRYESKGTWFEHGRSLYSGRNWRVPPIPHAVLSYDLREALLDHMYSPIGRYVGFVPYSVADHIGRISKVQTTVTIQADDTTTITTPAGEKITLLQAAKNFDTAREVRCSTDEHAAPP